MFRKLFFTYIIIIFFMATSTNKYSVFLCIGIALIFAYMFARSLTKPINELTEATNEIAKGNYNKRIHNSSKDQIGELAETFNKMSRELKFTIIELNDRNSKMESILNSMFNGVIAIDFDYRILLINPVCYKWFEIQASAEQKLLYEIIRNNDLFDIINNIINTKKNKIHEITFNKDNDKIIFCVYASIIKSVEKQYGDENLGVLLLFQEITKIRKLEQMRTDFISNVTHELKTPLTSIKGFVDTLKNGAIDNREIAMRFLEIIDVEADRLYHLIQDTLTLSEIETKNKIEYVELNNIENIIKHVVEILKSKSLEKNIKINLNIQENLPGFMCNYNYISQMFINLIDNAIKYTENGFINIDCSKKETNIKIVIEDTGIGIPKESIKRIFERFYRVDKGRSRKMGGTGLGLSIVKHIVNLYNGSINVESIIDKGTKFIILLPYKNSKE